ncbi:30S ribosomal protein S6e [Candidatus Pacearchaeota archaeon]|nr:30S ribosomal protein S6e [Candidatus Pacearchaeota archaeon]
MAIKVNVSDKDGKTYKVEVESTVLEEKELLDTIKGEDLSADLAGYELVITAASDKSGFMARSDVEGVGTKRVLLKYGVGMHKKPKGEKKKGTKPKGLRLRKSVRGKVISKDTRQVNTKVIKEGAKKLADIFAKPTEGEEASKSE